MFCSNCGAKAAGNFCSGCGAALVRSSGENGLAVKDWADEIRYDVLLHFPVVRDNIARHAAQAKKGLSSEQYLTVCDLAFKPLTGVSLSTVASAVIPIYSRIGIQTGKKRKELVRRPTGKVLVAAICSLARFGWTLKQVHQGDDGCVLEATLPSDFWSFEGELVVSIHRDEAGSQVEAATKIPGQLYDWGKSQKCLDQLFEDLQSLVE